MCSVEKVFWQISEILQENPLCQSLFFNNVAGRLELYQKKKTQVFSREFYKISKNTFLQNTSGRLLLRM